MSTTKGAPFSRSPSSFWVSPFSAASFKISSIVSFDLFMITSSYNSSLNISHTNLTCTLIKSLVVTEPRWLVYFMDLSARFGDASLTPIQQESTGGTVQNICKTDSTLDMCIAIKCVETVYTMNFSLP